MYVILCILCQLVRPYAAQGELVANGEEVTPSTNRTCILTLNHNPPNNLWKKNNRKSKSRNGVEEMLPKLKDVRPRKVSSTAASRKSHSVFALSRDANAENYSGPLCDVTDVSKNFGTKNHLTNNTNFLRSWSQQASSHVNRNNLWQR